MTDLIVLVPTRDRPKAAAELIAAFQETCRADTFLALVVDEDDPTVDEYAAIGDTDISGIITAPSHTMVEALNMAAAHFVSTNMPFAFGFMGDDHRPRTEGWDARYVETLRDMGTGFVYGDDGLQHEKLPTQVAMTANIPKALNYMAPPRLTHLYVDNYWRDLGEHAGCLTYLPDVYVEHMHPIIGKAEWDDGHMRVNATSMFERDSRAYQMYLHTRMWTDVRAVQALREVA